MSSISIIGPGNMARVLAGRALAGGNAVEVIGRDASKADALVGSIGGGATTGRIGTAPAGDIVILALPYADAAPVVRQYGNALAGKVIVDITNPFNPDLTGLVTPRAIPPRRRSPRPPRRELTSSRRSTPSSATSWPQGPPAGRVHRRRGRRAKATRVSVRREPRAAPARRRRPDRRALARRNERAVDARHVRQSRPQQQLLHRPHRPRLTIRTFSIRTEDADIGHPAAIRGARGGEEPPHPISFHSRRVIVDQPDRDLARHHHPAVHPPWHTSPA